MDSLASKMSDQIDSLRDRLAEIACEIWDYAEAGGEEFKSSALLMDEFSKRGFAVERGLTGKSPDSGEECDMPTAFRAAFGNGGNPRVGVMLEYDALPNGHSCGHNLIAAAGLGAALALGTALEELPGEVVAIGTPAEEGGAPGKVEILHAGHFDGLDAVMMAHPSDRWNAESRFLSIVHPKNGGIIYRGRAAHASSEPERGRSALDAVLLFCNGVEFFREHVKDGSRMHYSIVNGGDAPNIVPDFAKVNIFVRSEDTNELNYMKKRVTDIASAAALMADVSCELEWDFPWYSPVKVPSFYSLARKSAESAGVGAGNFIDYDSFGSTDAGNVGLMFPLVHLDFKIAPLGTNWHSKESAEASRSQEGIEGMITAAKTIALTLYSLMTQPDLMRRIKDEFAARRRTFGSETYV
ncbi:MAG: amidohydrolase [Synergistaceae bacterium]|jgi:amidohydrolase|nr:amidohydrolase [Synergistaceae bacterium]